jgi:phage tail sheath protein FI
MPEYLTPGVYMEEFEIGARPIEGVSTSTAGFLGLTERGPTIPPKLVTSWDQFVRIYGSHIDESYLAYAVEGFFNNGGQRCYIGRIVRDGATPASLTSDKVTITAVGKGSWGKRVGIRIEIDPKNPDPNRFNMTLAYWSKEPDSNLNKPRKDKNRDIRELLETASYVESYNNLTANPDDSADYYKTKFGDPLKNLSNLVVLGGSGKPKTTDDTVNYFEFLNTDGIDGTNTAQPDQPVILTKLNPANFEGKLDTDIGKKNGLTAFEDIDEISILNVPDIYHEDFSKDQRQTIIDDVLTQCEELKDRFAIIDAELSASDPSQISVIDVAGRQSKYGAIYHPWIRVYDPITQALKSIPPGGYVAGIYARSDAERGVHKAPANEIVRGARELAFTLTDGEQGILNPRGINVIRSFNERGILVWGARTSKIDPLWKYVNVRRLFIYIEKSINKGTQWVVFEPNDEKLWARVKATITQFLTGVWKDGALMGTKPEEAFFVKCDRSTMTQDDIDNGRLICIIGIAPVKPAEFVIFRIAQWQGGSAATE